MEREKENVHEHFYFHFNSTQDNSVRSQLYSTLRPWMLSLQVPRETGWHMCSVVVPPANRTPQAYKQRGGARRRCVIA